MALRIKNWEKFQHYKNRKPPWIRLYNDLLDDPDFDELPGDLVKLLLKLWLAASEHSTDGTLPDLRTLSLKVRVERNMLAKQLRQLNHWVEFDDCDLITGCQQHASDVLDPEGETETEGETDQRQTKATRMRASCSSFEMFWKHYPNKKGKDAALKAWKKRSDLPPIDELLQIIEIQKTWDIWKRGYVPNPATWINQGRWKDEPGPSAQLPTSGQGTIDFLRREMERAND